MRKTRLIDANKLRKDILGLADCYNGFSDTYDKAQIVDMIDEQPTVYPVKHGQWIDADYYDLKCSRCGERPLYYFDKNECDYYLCRSKYCPQCGASMDEV